MTSGALALGCNSQDVLSSASKHVFTPSAPRLGPAPTTHHATHTRAWIGSPPFVDGLGRLDLPFGVGLRNFAYAGAAG